MRIRRLLVMIAMSLLASLGATGLSAKEWKEVRLASEGAYPPFNELAPDGSLRGLDIDIGNAVCAEMKLKCVWVKQEWDGMIPALMARKFDAILASMSITEERKKVVDFTNKYYASALALIGKNSANILPDAGSLKGRKVAVQRGTVADNYASKFWATQGVSVVRYAKQDEAYSDLVAGRVDGVLVDYLEASGSFLASAPGKSFSLRGDKIYGKTSQERDVVGDGVGIALRKKDVELKELFNKGIAAIRANGTYSAITKKYFKDDIYGN